jgi:hypothetical protein
MEQLHLTRALDLILRVELEGLVGWVALETRLLDSVQEVSAASAGSVHKVVALEQV